MSNKSDHTKPQFDINQYLPEVYKSDVNKSVFDVAFNRHFTKDDTSRVTGYVGIGNPQALVDRQIQEPTPHRQAYQLAPTMYTKIGTAQSALSFKAFSAQLELMGVDINRSPLWENALQFNWVPPVNIDMLVNYSDYFWAPDNQQDVAQYFTIENKCEKSRSKVTAYNNLLQQRGELFAIKGVDFLANTFAIAGKYDDLYTSGFVFFTKDSNNANLQSKYWTSVSSSYDSASDRTTIVVVEPLAIHSASAPTATFVGQWWLNTTTNAVSEWTGTVWQLYESSLLVANISLGELLSVYQSEANCACNQDYGWDTTPWDDNQVGTVVWNQSLLVSISFTTEAAWITANGIPAEDDIWYDLSTDTLKQYDFDVLSWLPVASNFSAIVSQTTGTSRWDMNLACEPQALNQWSSQNKWIHKSEVQSFANARRAAVPIFEYDSNIELNQWVMDTFAWKYRADPGASFVSVTVSPSRIELEPVKGFTATNVSGIWTVVLFNITNSSERDVDYTSTFIPGYKFRITDDNILSDVYTVASSEYKEDVGGFMRTVVTIVETNFVSPPVGGGLYNTRIEPLTTTRGDTWRGYQLHWLLDVSTVITAPVTSQAWNIYRRQDETADPVGIVVPNGLLYVASTYQELTIQTTGVVQIDLDSTLLYNPSTLNHFALPGGSDLRVYVNGVRQYGNYQEQTVQTYPDYTLVGTNPYTSIPVEYVTGVLFDFALQQFDIVRIEVGCAASADMGLGCLPVRTVEDETEFASELAAGTQPLYRSLTQYRLAEQVKTQVNQYPLFNVYDVVTGDVVKAANIFGYSEDSSYPINTSVQRRIVASTDGKEFQFTQTLLDRDDNLLYGYRNTAHVVPAPDVTPLQWWYNPSLEQLRGWDGKAWVSSVQVDVGGLKAIRTPIVSEVTPTTQLQKSYWYNPLTNVLYQYVASSWTPVPLSTTFDTVVVGADPSLQTIWKHGTNNEQFVPQYVDKDRLPVTVGSVTGDWQLPDQWMFNPEHRNHANIKYSELFAHFKSIISLQPQPPGLPQGSLFTYRQEEYNYGLGGTIKEHNDSLDTLISAVNVSNVTPVGTIEFAQEQYAANLQLMRDLYNKSIVSLLTQHTQASIADLGTFVTESVINRYEQNEFVTQVFGDSSAYDSTTGTGVEHWIATSPMFGLSAKYQPHLNSGVDFAEIFHHDGHRSQVQLSAAEQDKFTRQLVQQPDARGGANATLGLISPLAPIGTKTAFVTAFGGTQLRPGVYWYRVGGGNRALYRFDMYAISDSDPSIYLNGAELPDGVMYYNTVSEAVYEKTGSAWVRITVSGAGDISPMWTAIDLRLLLAGVILEIEQRLHDVTPNYPATVFDYSMLTSSLSEQTVYDAYTHDRFNAYVTALNIKAPLINTTYNAVNAFSWNYISSVVTSTPFTPTLVRPVPAAQSSWQQIYTTWYNTPYPHLEPWMLQGFKDKPTWWDDTYKDTTGARRWVYTHATTTGMWENIRKGVVPTGKPLPSGVLSTGANGEAPTYNYFSVNIGDVAIDGYAPDAVLPPYFDNTVHGTVVPDARIRSLYVSLSTEISAPDADYAFGDGGPVEWQWRTSIWSAYDQMVIAFLMQPVRFMHYAFGPQYVTVDELQVETTFKNVYAHQNALFHGDLYNTNQTYTVRGLNQWYVNFNRYSGYDTNTQFRSEWAGWTPLLTYQFAGIADTSTFEVANKYFDVNSQDYNIVLANSGVISDVWADAFDVSVLTIPPAVIQYNSQAKWKLEIDTLATIPRTVKYYGVKSYPFYIDRTTDLVYVFRYPVVAATPGSDRVYVSGDQTFTFVQGSVFTITGSASNDGTYTVISSVYELSANRTRLNVMETVSSSAAGGYVDLQGKSASWDTGDSVVVSSSKLLPAPLVPNTAYYVVKIATNVYKLAETYNESLSNVTIDMTTNPDGDLTISQIASSFRVYGGAGHSTETWFHYEIDTNDIRYFTPPMTFYGMQTLINVIDGYAQVQKENGLLFGVSELGEFDPTTGRTVDWQLETERFIDWAYGLRRTRLVVSDRYQFSADVTSNQITFIDSPPNWVSGTRVVVSTTGTLPSPLLANTPYYVQQTGTPGVIQLSVTSLVIDSSSIVDFTTGGSGTLYIGLYNKQNSFPSFEINPSRNNYSLNTPKGVLSNVIEGPYADIRVQQTIFDQYGRPLKSDKMTVYRYDKQSTITMRPQVANDVDKVFQSDPYNYIHFGGGHFFLEGYEHYILFNDYTVSSNLIYDPFLGLNTKKFNLDYYEKDDYSLRPTLGGFYLINGTFERNMEGSADDMRHYYDPYGLNTVDVAQRAQALIGYTGRSAFLDLLDINSKSQFMFYRGMIQAKGSINSVKAFINSRRFVDAKMDEFWAWKIAEFGDARPRVYPEIKLFSADGTVDDVRLEFLANTELDTDPEVLDDVAIGFKTVSFRDNTRWNIFPEQKQEIESPLFLDAETTSMTSLFSGTYRPTSEEVQESGIQFWFDGADVYAWDATLNDWSASPVPNKMTVRDGQVYFKLDAFADGVRVIRRTLEVLPSSSLDFGNYTSLALIEGTGLDQFTRVNSETVRFTAAGFYDVLVIFTINASKAKISPAKLIDTKANVVLQNIPLWHPALGYHYYVAEHNIDLQQSIDPAQYQVTINPYAISSRPWNVQELGTVWLDTSELGYVPYYDEMIYPNVNDRLYQWGKLAPWSTVRVYQWIESTIPPSQWDAQALADASNTTIAQNDKVTGTPRRTIFKRTRTPYAGATITSNVVTLPIGSVVTEGEQVLFTTTGTIPAGLSANVPYVASNVVGLTFSIVDPVTSLVVTVSDDLTGNLSVVPSFDPNAWVKQPIIREKIYVPFTFVGPYPQTVTTIPLSNVLWTDGDVASVYINGVLVQSDVIVSATGPSAWEITVSSVALNEKDIVDVVRPIHAVTDTESAFDPDVEDDGTVMVQWKEDFEYTISSVTTGGTNIGEVTTTYYYFWVENATSRLRVPTDLSVYEVAIQLETIPSPYFVVQKPKDDPVLVEKYGYGVTQYGSVFSMSDIAEQFFVVPVLYRQAILRNIASYLTDDDRYIARFTRDLTLRDNPSANGKQVNLKNRHEEWFLFRQEQPSTLPLELWNRLIEAMMGTALDDSSIRVPSLDRELYDASYGTDTRYGLGVDQAFVDKTLAIATVLAYLEDPTNDFYPADLDDFFARNNFDTPSAVKASMQEIYNTFPANHVNSIWFNTLSDALSTRAKYKELLKTSWIALHGIRVLEVGGLFDE